MAARRSRRRLPAHNRRPRPRHEPGDRRAVFGARGSQFLPDVRVHHRVSHRFVHYQSKVGVFMFIYFFTKKIAFDLKVMNFYLSFL